MYTDPTVKPKSPAKESFYEIFQRTLNSKSGSRPPKTELTGVLIPLRKLGNRLQYDFKLETEHDEYLLSMGDSISRIAKKLEWEEVTVKGHLDADERIFDVEKISLSNRSEPYKLSLGRSDWYFELDRYKRAIARQGQVEVAPEYFVS